MAIQIDTTRALRRPGDVEALIQAVIAGNDHDEAEWIEWKSTLDLSSTEGQFTLAKQILGSANRMPDQAARFVEGLGYIIVGAEPGAVRGVTPVDVARLGQSLAKYLGTPGPVWHANYVEVQEKQVLVVTVEAPRYGDRMHSLARAFHPQTRGAGGAGAPAATVFVRKHARTEPAGPGDIRALEDRFARGLQEEQALELRVDWPDAVLRTLDISGLAIGEWVRRRLDAVAGMEPPRDETPSEERSLAAVAMGVFHRDTRTDEEYLAEVEEHVKECADRLVPAMVHEAAAKRINVVELRVTNPTPRNLPDVEVVLTIDAMPTSAYTLSHDHEWSFPAPPKAKGTRPPDGLFTTAFNAAAIASLDLGAGSSLSKLIKTTGSAIDQRVHIRRVRPVKIVLHVGDMRPHEARVAAPFVLVTAVEPGSSLPIQWSATSTRVDAVQEGELLLPVSPAPLLPADLIDPATGTK